MAKLCVVTTSPLIVDFFLRGHLNALGERHELSLIVNVSDPGFLDKSGIRVTVIPMPIERKISLLRDLWTLWSLLRYFRGQRFDGIISVAPKAGLLAMTAGWLARIPYRCHIFQGEVWVTRQGVMRRVLRLMDVITARAATHVLVISRSERDFLLKERVVSEQNSQILANGSLAGVDTTRFRPDPAARSLVRKELRVPGDQVLAIFMGRITRDKGVLDLAVSFAAIAAGHPEWHLLFVGPDEDALRAKLEQAAGAAAAQVHFSGLTSSPERYMAAADFLCLPSYREGFGNVIIEAASIGIPALGSRIYGIADALIEDYTGLMHEPGNVDQLSAKLKRLFSDSALRTQLGQQARERALTVFSSTLVVEALVQYVDQGLGGCM
jgi:glycosyltransferase involved in cell wall biosynthesis